MPTVFLISTTVLLFGVRLAMSFLKKANRLHRRAENLLLPSETMSTDNKFHEFGILPLNKQFWYNTLVMMFNAYLNEGPIYLTKLLNISDRSHRYLILVRRIDLYKARFSFQCPGLWNSLPLEIRQCRTLASFKPQLRKSDKLNRFYFF